MTDLIGNQTAHLPRPIIVLNTPEGFTHTLETEYARWGKVVRWTRIKPE